MTILDEVNNSQLFSLFFTTEALQITEHKQNNLSFLKTNLVKTIPVFQVPAGLATP